jgi:hypothetical protein
MPSPRRLEARLQKALDEYGQSQQLSARKVTSIADVLDPATSSTLSRLETVDTNAAQRETRAVAERKSTTYEGKVTVTVEAKPPGQQSAPSFWSRLGPSLKHPLTIALVAAAFTALLLPVFTRQYQDRQKERELKKGLLEQMSTASTTAVRNGISLVNGQLRAAGGEEGENAGQVYARLRNVWLIQRATVRSAIVTYFPHVNSCWYSYERIIADYLGLVDKKPANRKTRIENIKNYVNSDLRDVYGEPGNVDNACDRLKTMPTGIRARYRELKGKMRWDALTLPTDDKGKYALAYAGAYAILGEELLIADDRVIKTIVDENASGFSHGIRDWFD